MKIFVIGATGFIGRKLALRLLEEGHEVVCGVRSMGRLGPLSGRVTSIRMYLEYKETISRILKKEHPEVVYHAAALVKSRSLKKLRRVNVEGTRNVLDACLEEGIRKIVYISSVAVISGNPEVPLTDDLPYKPTNAYGQSKLEAEKLAVSYRKKGLKIAILRPCMVYGEGEPHGLPFIIEVLKKRYFPIFGKGEKKLHLVSVENVVDVLLVCLSKEKACEGTFLVADREVLTVKEIIDYITKILNIKSPLFLPQWIALVLNKIPFVKRYVSLFMKDRVYSIERLKEKLDYVPRVSVYDGLKRAVLAYEKKKNY